MVVLVLSFLTYLKIYKIKIVDNDLIKNFVSSVPLKGEEEDVKGGLARLIPRCEDDDTVQEHLMHIGDGDSGSLFKVSDDDLKYVTDVDLGGHEGVFQLDHYKSDMVFKNTGHGDTKRSIIAGLETEYEMTQDILDTIEIAKKVIIIASQGCNDSAE